MHLGISCCACILLFVYCFQYVPITVGNIFAWHCILQITIKLIRSFFNEKSQFLRSIHATVTQRHKARASSKGQHFHFMMTSSNGNIFRVTGRMWGEFTGHRWIPLTKASDAKLCCFLLFSVICASTNGWVNNRDAGDLRRHRAHYHVTVMLHRGDAAIWLFRIKIPYIGVSDTD